MSELDLVGLHEDGERLVLRGPTGERYTVRIDDAMRAAVRRDRPQLEHLRAQAPGALPVREIQARIRAGQTAEQVAAEAGVAIENVRRYEGPVLAEREHVVTRARAAVLGPDGAPTLDDLVTDRLAARGCDPRGTQWDSARDARGAWHVYIEFAAGGSSRVATWAYDPTSRSVEALDDEARWLSESDVETDPVRRDLTGGTSGASSLDDVVRPVLAAVDERAALPDDRATDVLLDDLEKRRGRRGAHKPVREHPGPRTLVPSVSDRIDDADELPPTDEPDAIVDAPVAPVSPVHLLALPLPADPADGSDADGSDGADSADGSAGSSGSEGAPTNETVAGARPSASQPPNPQPSNAQPAGALAGGHEAHSRRGGRRSRTKIPSWDEIMFGNKPEK